MPKVYVLVGIPGSGKSTWANNQDWAKNCAYVSTDVIVEKFAAEQNKTYSEVFESVMPSAVDLMVEQILFAKLQNKDIIWDQTSTTILSRKKKFRMLPKYHHIAVVFKTPPQDELIKRLSNRPGKNIPWKVVSDMIDNFEIPTEEEGFKEIWYAE